MKQALRILMVSEDVPHPAMGGLGQHAVTLAGALAKAGHRVDFMGSRRFPYDEAAQAALALPGAFFPDLRWLFGSWKEQHLGFFNPLRRAFLARDFARIIMRRAGDYDVVHYHGHVPDVGAFVPDAINFVQTRHDQGSDCLTHTRFRGGEVCKEVAPQACAACIARKPNYLQTRLSAWAVRQFRTRVRLAFARHKTVFVSDMLRKNLARTAGSGIKGAVVHNFLDTHAISQMVSNPERLPGLERNARVFIVAGKLYPPKGIEPFLIKIAPRLDDNTHIVVIGDGPQEEQLKNAFASPHVHFLGWCNRERTLKLMAGSDAVIVPSIWEEPCGTTILEGLFLSRPTYALARGGTPELEKYERYKDQLRLHSNMEELVADLITNAHANTSPISNEFSWGVEHAIARLLDIYRQQAGAKHTQAHQ